MEIVPGIVLYKDFFLDETNILSFIKKECHFDKFTINNKELCRTGSFEGVPSIWLRCPSIEYQTIHPFSNMIKNLNKQILQSIGLDTNIVKIQKYESESYIYPHSDKILDLEVDQPIVVARFGSTRTCVLINKVSKETIEVNVPNNSLLVISYQANLLWKHGITKEITNEDSYSIVFRRSVTFKYQDYVYGKTLEELKSKLHEKCWIKEQSKLELVKCYSKENSSVVDLSIYKDIINNSIWC
jgi:hypothetical protein